MRIIFLAYVQNQCTFTCCAFLDLEAAVYEDLLGGMVDSRSADGAAATLVALDI